MDLAKVQAAVEKERKAEDGIWDREVFREVEVVKDEQVLKGLLVDTRREVVFKYRSDIRVGNIAGNMHGGLISGLADYCSKLGVEGVGTGKQRQVTEMMKSYNFVRGIEINEDVHVVISIDRSTRRFIFVSYRILNMKKEVVNNGNIIYFIQEQAL